MKPVWIYYHVAGFEGWSSIVDDHQQQLAESGLWDRAQRIIFQLHYRPEIFYAWTQKCKYMQDPRVTVRFWNTELGPPSYEPLGETYSIIDLHTDCEEQPTDRYILRLSNKGVSHRTKPHWPLALAWNQYLAYWNIDQWQFCVQALDLGYDTVGCNWHEPGDPSGHWSGNWWWARSTYLQTLAKLKLPHTVNFQKQLGGWSNRHDAEVWVGQGRPKRLELHHNKDAVVYHVEGPKDYRL